MAATLTAKVPVRVDIAFVSDQAAGRRPWRRTSFDRRSARLVHRRGRGRGVRLDQTVGAVEIHVAQAVAVPVRRRAVAVGPGGLGDRHRGRGGCGRERCRRGAVGRAGTSGTGRAAKRRFTFSSHSASGRP